MGGEGRDEEGVMDAANAGFPSCGLAYLEYPSEIGPLYDCVDAMIEVSLDAMVSQSLRCYKPQLAVNIK